ncbi:hypothetical protein [Embleya scabrispora]|uniref:hypothetical protein n=1 Tax=Embleya scabrispora TaxID=159449 RepID=UPI0003A5FD7C|nr:hypothetical protein [Embleya scabrispora]MYS86133.1 hypothetical protein [Streptomyces sp. SID5474]
MIVIGLLIAAASVAFAALLVAYNTSGGPEYTVSMFDQNMVTLDTLSAFLAGLALALLFCAALALVAMGMRMRTRRRHASARVSEVSEYDRSGRAARYAAVHQHEGAHGPEAAQEHEWEAEPTAGSRRAGLRRDAGEPPESPEPPTANR